MLRLTVSPRFGDLDGLRHVNNAVLPVWFERARNPLFRLFTPDLDLEKWRLIMARIEVDFVGQLVYGHDVEIRTWVARIGTTSFTAAHEAWQRGALGAKGRAVVVHYDFARSTPVPIPPDVRAALAEYMDTPTETRNNP